MPHCKVSLEWHQIAFFCAESTHSLTHSLLQLTCQNAKVSLLQWLTDIFYVFVLKLGQTDKFTNLVL